jgi:hypothetical protein
MARSPKSWVFSVKGRKNPQVPQSPGIAEPYLVIKRGKTFQFTFNSTCGLPRRLCAEWQRRSFKTLPDGLSNYRKVTYNSEKEFL